MKKVITYGSFDLFHNGHYRLLERAKKLGEYLIVGITTENYDESRGKLNVVDSLMKRVENVQKTGFVDEVIIEDHEGQKLEDILKYNIDVFTVGSDWIGTFDYLKEYCEVVYLERTKDVSSTMLREKQFPIIRMGIIGSGRIAKRFPNEVKYVSGIELNSVYNPSINSAKEYYDMFELDNYTDDLEVFYNFVDAVNIASPHETHYKYIKDALNHGKHVLSEKPMVLTKKQSKELYNIAYEKGVILMEGIKTAYVPGFIQLLGIARSGVIGNIRDVEACFTKLVPNNCREMIDAKYGGSFTELASYVLLPIIKLMGEDYKSLRFDSIRNEDGIDIYTKAYFKYENGLATAKTGLGIKSEGQLVISGTKGYILAKSPWWLTSEFEICFEDTTKNQIIKTKFLGDGLRYEISEFVKKINKTKRDTNEKLFENESKAIIEVIEKFMNNEN